MASREQHKAEELGEQTRKLLDDHDLRMISEDYATLRHSETVAIAAAAFATTLIVSVVAKIWKFNVQTWPLPAIYGGLLVFVVGFFLYICGMSLKERCVGALKDLNARHVFIAMRHHINDAWFKTQPTVHQVSPTYFETVFPVWLLSIGKALSLLGLAGAASSLLYLLAGSATKIFGR